MSKRFDNKRLFYILAGLTVILLLTVVLKIPKQRSTISESLVNVDTSVVQKIIFIPKAATGNPFEFVRDNRKWSIKQGSIVAEPVKNATKNILSAILEVKPRSLVAVDKSKWKEYELTDSLATRIRLLGKKGKVLADLMIGKFTYKQVSNPYQYGGNNIEGTSFVRLSDDNKIYSVDGFLAFSFSGKFNDWRDKSFLKCKKDDIIRITFTYPSDSSFVLEQKDSVWYAGSRQADSLATSDYLYSIGNINGEDFRDDFKPATSPAYQMTIEGNNLLNVSVKCYKEEGKDEYVFNSGLNPDVYFTGTKKGLFGELFKPVSYFVKSEKNKK